MDLYLAADLGNLYDPPIGDLLSVLQLRLHVHFHGAAVRSPGVFPFLDGQPLLLDLHGGSVHLVCIGGDLTPHDGFSETVARLDDYLLGSAAGVHGEHYAGDVGVDHLLHHDGKLHVLMGESLSLAVGDGSCGEEGGPAFPDLIEQVLLPDHVKEGLLLAGEAGVREVLSCRGGSDGHETGLVAFEQPFVAGHDLLLQVLRYLAPLEGFPYPGGRFHEGIVGGPVDLRELIPYRLRKFPALDEMVVGGGGKEECIRNRESGHRQLAKIGSLSADCRDVCNTQLINVHNSLCCHHIPCWSKDR